MDSETDCDRIPGVVYPFAIKLNHDPVFLAGFSMITPLHTWIVTEFFVSAYCTIRATN